MAYPYVALGPAMISSKSMERNGEKSTTEGCHILGSSPGHTFIKPSQLDPRILC